MKGTELLRLVGLNINQNKFKTVMTSIGIVVGAATIVMVIGIGRGGQMDVAEQFSSLNAGAIDVSYEWEGEDTDNGGFSLGNMFGNMFAGGGFSFPGGGGEGSGGFSFPGGGDESSGSFSPPGGGGESSGSFSPPGGGGESSGGFSFPSGGGESSGGFSPPGGGEDSGGFNFPGGGDMPEEMPDDRMEDMPEDMPEDMQEGFDRAEKEGTAESEDVTEEAEAAPGTSQSDTENTEEETSVTDERINQEQIILTEDDVEDIETFVSGIRGATISYTTRGTVEGGQLTSEQNYTVAGVKEDYMELSNLELTEGEFLKASDDGARRRVCVLGAAAAKEIFGKEDAVGNQIYIDDRTYTVQGVLETTGTVSAGISPDTSVLIPYETGIKYMVGTDISPTLTVIAQGVDQLEQVISDVKIVLSENYHDTEFVFSDAGSKMEAAQASNETLTLLLSAVAMIVFMVGGIGIMNVLFVSVKERTNEIGILKALGGSRGMILMEFLIESAVISLIGGILGVGISFAVTPIVEYCSIRVETNLFAWLVALGFAVLTGTIFGIYPAWKASRLEPVEALNEE